MDWRTMAENVESAEPDEQQSLKEEIASWVLECDRNVTISEVRDAFPERHTSINSALSRLVKENTLQRISTGVYAAPEHRNGKQNGTTHHIPDVDLNKLRSFLQMGIELGEFTEAEAHRRFWEAAA